MTKYMYTLLLCVSAYCADAQFSIHSTGQAITKVNDIEDGGNNRMIFATDKGIFIYENGNWKNFSTANGLSHNNVITIEPYSGGFLYSTENTHVGLCDFNSISNDRDVTNANYPFGFVSAMHVSNSEVLYGTNVGTVFSATDVNKPLPQVPASLQFGATIGYVSAINQLQGFVNYHVIATHNTIIIYDGPGGYPVQIASPQIPSNKVLCNVTSGTTTFDGTDKGLYVFDFNNPSYQINMSNSPIPSNVINAVAVSGNNLFLGTPAGLAVRVNNKWETFTTANSNLPSSDIVQLAVEKTTNALWLATKEGHICRVGMHQFPTAIESIPNRGLAVYPNPATDKLYIGGMAATGEGVQYRITDITGKTMLQGTTYGVVDVSRLSRGHYVLEITQGSKSIHQGVVVY
jgi:hypothetical protein